MSRQWFTYLPLVFALYATNYASTVVRTDEHRGTLFQFVPGVGACGFNNVSSETVASVSTTFFNTYPNATANPNKNPLCKRKVFITSGQINLTATIVDTFTDKGVYNIGLSPSAFNHFASSADGIVPNVTWHVMQTLEGINENWHKA